MLYCQDFLRSIPPPQHQDRRPLVNIKANHDWLLDSLNSWYGELVSSGNSDLYSHLRCIEDSENFTAGFWEIVLLRYLRENGYAIEYSPTIDGRTPDFYFTQQDLIADVVSISDPHYRNADQAHIDRLVRMINAQSLPFDVTIVNFSFAKATNPRLRRIVEWLSDLASLSDDEKFEEAHEYENHDASIEVLLRNRTEGNVVKAVGMYSIDSEQLKKVIKGRLRDKVKKYRRPMIVFVCEGLGFWSVDKDCLHMALYGD